MKHRKRNRMEGYDYSSDNLYFVTSCTHDKIPFFGDIEKGEMVLNELGQIAHQQWWWLVEQYAYVKSHAFIVMPNHIHGILEINREYANDAWAGRNDVGTGRDLSLPVPVKIKSLSQLMGVYKTTTSKHIHLLGRTDFAWQRSFHDHIIRDARAYENIKNYIHHNPQRWQEDRFNSI